MNKSTTNSQRQKGSVLVMATVLSFAMFVGGLSYLSLVDKMVMETDYFINMNKGFYGTSARLTTDLAYAKIYSPGRDYNSGRSTYYDNVEYEGHILYGGNQQGLYGSNYNYTIVANGYATSNLGYEFDYEITTGCKTETFADYLYITDAETDLIWHNRIYFWTPDTLDGKVHTNDHISIMSWADRPVFKKRVTSSASFIDPSNNHARFDEGLYLNMPEIRFPDQAAEVRAYAGSNYTYGNGEDPNVVYWLVFLDNGYKVNLSTNRGSSFQENFANLPLLQLPAEGAIFVNAKCWVSTTAFPDLVNPPETGFNGRVTVASSDTLYIRGKTVYSCWNDQTRTVPMDCNDALGLISEKWVLVSDRLPGGHFGITINAGIAALRGSFSVDRVYDDAQEHQSLLVYGSLAQYHRGIVHRGNCGGGVGYCQKDYKYDDRFRTNPPPHFIPISDDQSIYLESFYN